jgi:hypothetical protein
MPFSEPLPSSEEICEALVRHTEMSGSEVFEKTFVKGPPDDVKVCCVVFCMIGDNAGRFQSCVHGWLAENGFKLDLGTPDDAEN